ncbi:hypothetical protein [Nonomuraea sp. NPDC049141]|uniref:hypothetical protein n=1 Tax=Nonomuraea sp. NPDC049141 TaxID=3155500 RepID=UPI0033FD183A
MRSFLQESKENPGPRQLETPLGEIVKLERVKAIGLPEGASEKVVEAGGPGDEDVPLRLRRRPAAGPGEAAGRAVLVTQDRDDRRPGWLLIQLVHTISMRAQKKKVENEISTEFARVRGKNDILVRLAQAALVRDKPWVP